ncbi:MAG: hypothetical protein AB1625_11820 [Acidobacteriota bacterium]
MIAPLRSTARRAIVARAAAALLVPLCAALPLPAQAPKTTVPAGLTLVPEAERPLRRLVVGLDPLLTSPYMLPEGNLFDAKGNRRYAFVRRQLYWLNFEMMHGRIVTSIPKWTRLFVAVPDPRLHAPELGDEREEFREYLKVRVGWTAEEIAERVRFFVVGRAVPYPQDIAEPIGSDAKGRLVLGIGAEADVFYRDTLRTLVRAFPDDFAMHSLPGVNTEGGDVELVRLPGGNLGLLAGHHRVLRWLEYRYGEGVLGREVSRERLEETREAFRNAFFGLDVVFVNEDGLRSPSVLSDELFHSDMIVNIARGAKGPVAFVPSYGLEAVDAVSREPLAPDVVRRAQSIYDRVARQLAAHGFRIARLPFADHPVRNPVNVGKYTGPDGAQVVLLGKYPYHFALPGSTNPQRELQKRLDDLAEALDEWRNRPSEPAWERVSQAFTSTWSEMDQAAASPNPTFDRQAGIYAAEGISVVPVPIFPTGEGGLHCLSLAQGPVPPSSSTRAAAFLREPRETTTTTPGLPPVLGGVQ